MPQQIVEIPGVGQVEFPDGMSDTDIAIAAARLFQEAQAPEAPAAPRPRRSAMEVLGEAEMVAQHPDVVRGQQQMLGKVAPVALSVLGGIGGTALGGPLGGVAGAGLGAAAGEGVNAFTHERPVTARNMAVEGAKGAAGQVIGGLAGKAISGLGRMAGRGLVRASVRPSAAVRRGYGGSKAVADTILDERLVTSGGANRAVQASSDRVSGILRQAAPLKHPVRATELIDDLNPVAKTAADRVRLGLPDETANVARRLQRIEAANPSGIGLEDAQGLKREAQDLASRVYRARAAGSEVTDLGAETNEAVASGMRRAIERRVPAVAGENARTQRLMGVRQALQEAEDRPHNLTDMLALLSAGGSIGTGNPVPLMTGAAIRALASSRGGAAAGIGVNEASKVLGNPTANRAALLAALLGQSE